MAAKAVTKKDRKPKARKSMTDAEIQRAWQAYDKKHASLRALAGAHGVSHEYLRGQFNERGWRVRTRAMANGLRRSYPKKDKCPKCSRQRVIHNYAEAIRKTCKRCKAA